jgi:hypothetical protein
MVTNVMEEISETKLDHQRVSEQNTKLHFCHWKRSVEAFCHSALTFQQVDVIGEYLSFAQAAAENGNIEQTIHRVSGTEHSLTETVRTDSGGG